MTPQGPRIAPMHLWSLRSCASLCGVLLAGAACTSAGPEDEASLPIEDEPIGEVASAAGSIGGWQHGLGDTGAPGNIRRIIPISSGGYAAIVYDPTSDAGPVIYRWNGLADGQAVWTPLSSLPWEAATPIPPFGVTDIAEYGGRLYAAGHFKWVGSQNCNADPPNEPQPCPIDGAVYNIASYPLAANAMNPRWAPLYLGADETPYYHPARFHVVPAEFSNALKGLYLAGGGLAESNDCVGIVRLLPLPSTLLGDGLGHECYIVGNIPTNHVQEVAHGTLALAPGAAPQKVIVAAGRFDVYNNELPVQNGFGLGAWDGTNWHAVATGISHPPQGGFSVEPIAMGLAFAGTDLYVSGSFMNVPAVAPATEPVPVNGFAKVQEGAWQALQVQGTDELGVPEWLDGMDGPNATNTPRLFAGDPSASDSPIYALTRNEVWMVPGVVLPWGTHTNNGIARWQEGKWQSLQGGTGCEPGIACGEVTDVLPLGGAGILLAGDFTNVGRWQGDDLSLVFSSQKLAKFLPTKECPGDLNNDAVVDGLDMTVLLSAWSLTGASAPDLNNDQVVDGLDMTVVLSAWGSCPG